ncbi:MAG: hypothetical protein ACLGHP_01220 [Vicinamibacteria bacterium]
MTGPTPGADETMRRFERDALVALVGLAVAAFAVWPERPSVAAGVVGGGALAWLSYHAIRSAVDAGLGGGAGAPGRRRALVKFFTRHAILALAAYGMMVRLHLDPVGMLVGVSAPVAAATAAALRSLKGS